MTTVKTSRFNDRPLQILQRMPIRTAIIDDDAVTLQLIKLILESEPEIELAGAYADAESALKSCSSRSLPIHVYLVDVELPGIRGVECVEKMMQWALPPQIVMLTSSEDDDTILDCVAAGACGYLLKPIQPHLLVSSIIEAANGGAPISSKVAKSMISLLRSKRSAVEQATSKTISTLSEQENKVLQQIAMGNTYTEIADNLHLSDGTVRTYIQRIYRKLGVHNRSQAIAKLVGITQNTKS